MKRRYIKVTIEAPSYDAKAIADHYIKDRKYEVISRSRSFPCRDSSNVRIYLHIVKKTQLDHGNSGRWNKTCKKKRRHISEDINYEALMRKAY